MTRFLRISVVLGVSLVLLPADIFACACGCNVFSVGTRWTMPISPGFSMVLHYNYMNQNENWGNWRSAPAELNDDQEIRTSFYTVGLRWMANRDWGVMAEAPVWDRYFRTSEEGEIQSATHTSAGDVRLMGMYTGLSEDMSIGLEFGLKLPTGAINQSLLDRDTQIGTGTTDLLLGGYHMEQEKGWGWYVQVLWQHALNTREEYRPGDSFDMSGGIHYDELLGSLPLVPMVQLEASFRGIDSGLNAYPANTGYERLYLSPGLQIVATNYFSIHGDVRIPLLTHVRGYQLIAPALVSVALEYDF